MSVDSNQCFSWAEIELAVYRKGFLTVKIDFDKSVLVWKDSNRWFNNFVRGLPHSQMQPLQHALANLLQAKKTSQQEENLAGVVYRCLWRVSLANQHETLTISSQNIELPEWQGLVRNIERITRRTFKL